MRHAEDDDEEEEEEEEELTAVVFDTKGLDRNTTGECKAQPGHYM